MFFLANLVLWCEVAWVSLTVFAKKKILPRYSVENLAKNGLFWGYEW